MRGHTVPQYLAQTLPDVVFARISPLLHDMDARPRIASEPIELTAVGIQKQVVERQVLERQVLERQVIEPVAARRAS
jgi:hypothetical protein